MPTPLSRLAILALLAVLQPAFPAAPLPRLEGRASAPSPESLPRLAVRATSPLPVQLPRLPLLPESRVWVDGTSNKNDWTVKATELSGFVHLQLKGDALEIEAGGFTVVAKSLVSEHGVIMDRLMQGALKCDEHPEIVYQLGSATVTAQPGGKYELATTGRVTIVGVTKDVAQTVHAERLPNGRIRFTGAQPVLMNEFGMRPPTAMFGALRTGNRVVVNFELIVKP